ncbi:hypothetical protein OPT61_g10541 [Boeremia exigua]|uniref:Uncharacterized protein n=1 Tax=Boeremia exigua TaxID=749465 RepID=A0ACC2HQ03_9PLEO|nr:hypothetical protein OPT61_g10541 [Boeremia exigua]
MYFGGRVTLAIFHCRKPTIGALQGSAVGIGITMTLPMNIRIAYRDAKIGFVFARRGLVMEACSSFFLPRLIGHSRAMQAITTGSVYTAKDKVFDGLFSELMDRPEDVLPRALQVAEDVVKNTSVGQLGGGQLVLGEATGQVHGDDGQQQRHSLAVVDAHRRAGKGKGGSGREAQDLSHVQL